MRKSRFNTRLAAILLLASAPLLAAGDCNNPQVSLPSNIRSVAIPTFTNTSTKAGVELDVTQRVLHEFLASSRLGVTTKEEEADAVIRGEIKRYMNVPVSWDQTNRIVQYKMQILCRVSFIDRRTGAVIWTEDNIDGVTSYSLLATPPETEESAVFKAADELARDIMYLIFEQRQYTSDDLIFTEGGSAVRPGEVQRR